MNGHWVRVALKEAGFYLKRRGKRHELWTNDKETIAVSGGAQKASPHTYRSLLCKLRKAKITCEL